MPEINLQHPKHGCKIAHSDQEAAADRANGWVDYIPPPPRDPEEIKAHQVEGLAEAIERAEKAEAKVKELKAEIKELKTKAPPALPSLPGAPPALFKADKT